MVLDKQVQESIAEVPNLVVPWFLMASYLYYCENESILSDTYYDTLSKKLLMEWDQVKHAHKHLIEVDDLLAGSMYRLKATDYPMLTKAAAHMILEELNE